MPATKKKSTKKKSSAASKPTWAETMKKALENKSSTGGWPDQGKPRDSAVKKLKRNVF